MSYPFSVLIGPYAEWRVRKGKKRDTPLDELPWYEALIDSGEVFYVGGWDGVPEVKIDGVKYSVWLFMPNQKRKDCPPRQMAFHDGLTDNAFEDWSWINPRAEMDWFTEAFAAELAILAEHFGGPPNIGWGPVLAR
jgi:hypothetical protein